MKKPPRFSRRIDAWMPEQLADTCEMVAQHQQLTCSAVIRQALQFYFVQIGALTPRSVPPQLTSGAHQQAAE